MALKFVKVKVQTQAFIHKSSLNSFWPITGFPLHRQIFSTIFIALSLKWLTQQKLSTLFFKNNKTKVRVPHYLHLRLR